MKARISAGLLMYRFKGGCLEVFLAHPGGPFFAHKDDGHWTIPKGEIGEGEDYRATAIREFKEEVCIDIDPNEHFIDLGSIRQKGGKTVHAWGVEQDWDDSRPFQSNTFSMEWPPRSGKLQEFPEVDRARFFATNEARRKIKESQIPLIERLEAAVGVR
jgi:predicted NUDIX family NTP pyrophosphohydrolase